MADISNSKQQADLLFQNVAGWESSTLDLINRLQAEIEMDDVEIKELRIALQGYLDDLTKERNLYKKSVEELNQAKAEIERLVLCIKELKHEAGKHERNYDPSEEVDSLINGIIQPLSASAVFEMAEKAVENHNKFEKFKVEIKAEAYRKCMLQLEAEIESSDKYIREYDDSELQKAYNKGLRDALKALKGLVGDDNA